MTDVGGILLAAAGVLIVAGIVVLFMRLSRSGHPTSGHYDPDAIGHHSWDPALPRWRFHLPSVQRGPSMRRGSGPPLDRTPRDQADD
jgi:hypothetical protein